MFKTMKTSDLQKGGPTKTLLYSHHGYGKTHQCRNFLTRYGRGLVLSGESGLKSLEDVGVEYLPFSSWDGVHDPDKEVYSFKGIVKMLKTKEFADAGFNWIAIDSLTELSERLVEYLEDHNKKSMDIGLWNDYARAMLGALKWIRDLPIHVYVSCLAKEEKDANDITHFWPHVKGQATSKQIPALFDHVFCGVKNVDNSSGKPRIRRFIISDEYNGWHGKSRDPLNRLKPVEEVDDVTELLHILSLDEEEYKQYRKTKREEREAKKQPTETTVEEI
jgi:hypothetical protein